MAGASLFYYEVICFLSKETSYEAAVMSGV